MLCCLTEKGNQVDPYAKALGTPPQKRWGRDRPK